MNRDTHADGLKVEGYARVREFALRFPEAYEEFPWGHCAIKVRKKIFVTLGTREGGFTMSLKLTDSNFEALLLPFTEPTHYGMGKHGWVTSHFPAGAKPPMPMLEAWIEEAYRKIAPKTVVAKLDADGLAPAAKGGVRRKATRKPTRKKTATKKKASKAASSARKRRKKASRKTS
jgi:predicted DNA-binding protein (MmcQ/YjbR family)